MVNLLCGVIGARVGAECLDVCSALGRVYLKKSLRGRPLFSLRQRRKKTTTAPMPTSRSTPIMKSVKMSSELESLMPVC